MASALINNLFHQPRPPRLKTACAVLLNPHMFPILIIEDDEYFLQLLETVFATEGYEVHGAVDGKEGFEIAKQVEPAVIIADLWMPKKEGLETIRLVRQHLPESYIIAMSGQPMLANISLFKLARDAGADATILKPFLPSEITNLVTELLHGVKSAATNGNHL